MTTRLLFVGLLGVDGTEISVPGYARVPIPYHLVEGRLEASQSAELTFGAFGADATVEACGLWAEAAGADPPLRVFPLYRPVMPIGVGRNDTLTITDPPSELVLPEVAG